MKKVIPPRLFNYKGLAEFLEGLFRCKLFLKKGDLVTPYSIFSFCIVSTFLIGLVERKFLIISITTFLYLIFIYLKLRFIAKRIKIKRLYPSSAREGEDCSLSYIIENRTNFNLSEYTFTDQFEGIRGGVISFESYPLIEKLTKKTFKIKKTFNNGMGEKKFGKLIVQIWDPLGIFFFQIEVKRNDKVTVYPSLQYIQNDWSKQNDENIKYGEFEIIKKGDTTNFLGIKDYREGEPFKNINWFLSQRSGKLLLNIFERLVDTKTVIYLNEDIKAHFGEGAKSSFEYCKDLLSAIAQEEMEKGDELEVVTDTSMQYMGGGVDFFLYLERYICNIPLKSINERKSVKRLMSSLYAQRGMTFIYISPIHNQNYLYDDIEMLTRLSAEGQHVLVIFISGVSYYYKELSHESKVSLMGTEKGLKQVQLEIMNKMRSRGIFCANITIDEQSFNYPLRELIKEYRIFQKAYDEVY